VSRRVLVIEDERDIRELVRLSLSRVGGYEVLVAGSGPDGVDLAEAERPDAILLDVMMPGLDGPATLERLRASSGTAEIPVLFLTAKVQAADRERLLGLGVSGIIAKPFDPIALPAQVAGALGWPAAAQA
jgi:CheY-like chemotaxis protein